MSSDCKWSLILHSYYLKMVWSLVLRVLTAWYEAMTRHRCLVHIAPIVLSRVSTTIHLITMITTDVPVKSMMQRANLINLRVVGSLSSLTIRNRLLLARTAHRRDLVEHILGPSLISL